MVKLKLNLDELSVESFPTTANGEPPRGTVRGAMFESFNRTDCGSCEGETCEGATCFTSCGSGAPPQCTCPVVITGDDPCV